MAVSAKASGDFDHQPQMAADEFLQSRFITMISPRESKLLFPLRAQHREPLSITQKVGERVASVFAQCCHCHLSSLVRRRTE